MNLINKRSRKLFTETLYLETSYKKNEKGGYDEIVNGYKFYDFPYDCPKVPEEGCDYGKNSLQKILDTTSVDGVSSRNYATDFELEYEFDYYHDWRI